MISDTLFEAMEQIKDYQHDAGTYKTMTDRIEVVTFVMDMLRHDLDTPPGAYPEQWEDEWWKLVIDTIQPLRWKYKVELARRTLAWNEKYEKERGL